ncbi:hypothetical protein BJP36_41000 [Moorena producens JHB]|uniref:Uncharacterized protein n=1 Tax=Moorena producens (strain JHB) TaxID=1454205 RepID=A0A9Q9SSC1_MOOP1|nr:hypothetical protein [Moorena producens]WAN68745.1 hypothetical protein BJP36_41000 [Moorena producens JHB]
MTIGTGILPVPWHLETGKMPVPHLRPIPPTGSKSFNQMHPEVESDRI